MVYFGDNQPWDLVVYQPETSTFTRVQIKSTFGPVRGRLKWTVGTGRKIKRCYLKEQVDVIALHDFASGDWYLVPVEELKSKTSVTIGPKQKTLTPFKNLWSVFEQPD